jgi:hypothetical protein
MTRQPGFDRQSWEQGIVDGAKRRKRPAWTYGPSKGPRRDTYSYTSGYIEGEAFRNGYEVSMEVARIAQRLIHEDQPQEA